MSGLLEPVVVRGRELAGGEDPLAALQGFLVELMAFQAAHDRVNDRLAGLDLPATSALRAELGATVRGLIVRAQDAGSVRSDVDPDTATTLVGETAYAVARAGAGVPGLTDVYLRVLLDGLRGR